MKIKNNKEFTGVFYVTIILLLLSIFSISYAYYRAKVLGNTTSQTGKVAKLLLNYEETNTILALNAAPIYKENYKEYADKISFSVNGNDNDFRGCYNLELNIAEISANLKNEDFKWILYRDTTDEIISLGDFSTATTTNNFLILDEQALEPTTYTEYTLYIFIEYSETENQIDLLNSRFEATVVGTAEINTCSASTLAIELGLETRSGTVVLGSSTEQIENYFDSSQNYYTFTAPQSGTYDVQLWGAQGGNAVYGTTYIGGYGAYTKGKLFLNQNDTIYIYVGGAGGAITPGYNGGGYGSYYLTGDDVYYLWDNKSGGGSTDIRCFYNTVTEKCELNTANLTWNNALGLNSRIMVAGGGTGGAGGYSTGSGMYNTVKYYGGANGRSAGGLYGTNSSTYPNTNGTQFRAGLSVQLGGSKQSIAAGFGYATALSDIDLTMSGGGGYYGGAGVTDNNRYIGGSGSSFISGHAGSVAIANASLTNEPRTTRTDSNSVICSSSSSSGYNSLGYNTDSKCSEHYSGKVFNDTQMIDGSGNSWVVTNGTLTTTATTMPNPDGGTYTAGTGRAGSGYARIKYYANTTKVIQITGGNYGELSCESDNTEVAVCQIKNDKLYIFGIGLGTANITVYESRVNKIITYSLLSTEQNFTLSETSGETKVGINKTVTMNGSGYGTLSCASSDNTKATCSISGTTITIVPVSVGRATITVTEGNYGVSLTYQLTVNQGFNLDFTQAATLNLFARTEGTGTFGIDTTNGLYYATYATSSTWNKTYYTYTLPMIYSLENFRFSINYKVLHSNTGMGRFYVKLINSSNSTEVFLYNFDDAWTAYASNAVLSSFLNGSTIFSISNTTTAATPFDGTVEITKTGDNVVVSNGYNYTATISTTGINFDKVQIMFDKHQSYPLETMYIRNISFEEREY